MTTNVDLCNMALSQIGEGVDLDMTIEPPNTANARQCALWLPKARELTLQEAPWTHASKATLLAHVVMAVTSVNTGTNRITVSAAHGMEDNDVVRVAATTTMPVPLEEDTDYYVRYVSSTVFELAEEEDGDAIDLTGAGSGTITVEKRSDRSDLWAYAYAVPTDLLVPRAVLPLGVSEEPYLRTIVPGWWCNFPTMRTVYMAESPPPQVALNKAGESVIYSNVEDARLVYTAAVTDPNQWSPLFSEAVMWRLAAFLAGAIKRESKTADWCLARYREVVNHANSVDSIGTPTFMPNDQPYDR